MTERRDLIINEKMKLVEDGDRFLFYAHPHVYEMDARVANEVAVFIKDSIRRNKPAELIAPVIQEKEYKCYICGVWRTDSEIEEKVGREYLCKRCYASVPAKKWDSTIEWISDTQDTFYPM